MSLIVVVFVFVLKSILLPNPMWHSTLTALAFIGNNKTCDKLFSKVQFSDVPKECRRQFISIKVLERKYLLCMNTHHTNVRLLGTHQFSLFFKLTFLNYLSNGKGATDNVIHSLDELYFRSSPISYYFIHL